MDPLTFIAVAIGAPPQGGEPPQFSGLLLMGAIFAIFYFVLIMPMKNKQKKLDELVKALKKDDRVIINPGIFGTIVGVEDHTLVVRIDEKTKIKVLKSAVSGLQDAPLTEKK